MERADIPMIRRMDAGDVEAVLERAMDHRVPVAVLYAALDRLVELSAAGPPRGLGGLPDLRTFTRLAA